MVAPFSSSKRPRTDHYNIYLPSSFYATDPTTENSSLIVEIFNLDKII